jgi:transcriptional regulator with XRE-family HTH domain
MGLDYGCTHMGTPIYFDYRPANFVGMSSIGHRIRGLRKTNVNLNQTELAALVGVDQSVISDIERGAGFGAGVLVGLADALNTTPQFIMRGGTDEAAIEANLLGLFRICGPDDKKVVLETAKAFAARNRAAAPASPQMPIEQATAEFKRLKSPPPAPRASKATPRRRSA